jgi:hypothetical protein
MRKIEFTKTEQAILLHRATLHDCLGEVYAHTTWNEGDSDEHFIELIEEGEKAAAQIERAINLGSVNLDALTPIELFVLQDCLDGSTYFASADNAVACGETTWGKVESHRQAAARLVEKFAAHGIKVTVPQA